MLYLLLAILASAAMAIVLKIQRSDGGNRYAVILGNYLTCIALSLFMIKNEGAVWPPLSSTIGMGLIAGAFYVGGLVTMQSSIAVHGAALSAAFSKLGLIVTLLVSFLWFGERPSALQILGLVLVLISLVVINLEGTGKREGTKGTGIKNKSIKDKSKESEEQSQELPHPRCFPYGLLLTLAACGLADAMSKVYAELGEAGEETTYFFLLFSTAALLTLFLAFQERRRTGKTFRLPNLAAGILVGIPNYFSSYLLLRSMQALPAFLASPVFCTGTILVVLLVSTLFLKERLGRFQLLGIALILGALVLLGIT